MGTEPGLPELEREADYLSARAEELQRVQSLIAAWARKHRQDQDLPDDWPYTVTHSLGAVAAGMASVARKLRTLASDEQESRDE